MNNWNNDLDVCEKNDRCVLYFQYSGTSKRNIKGLQALTFLEPTRKNFVLDPLAELYLDNQLCMKMYRKHPLWRHTILRSKLCDVIHECDLIAGWSCSFLFRGGIDCWCRWDMNSGHFLLAAIQTNKKNYYFLHKRFIDYLWDFNNKHDPNTGHVL